VQALRNNGYCKIIIGLTGNSMEDELVEFSNAGADLVLTKPLKPRSLAVILKTLQEIGPCSRVYSVNSGGHGERLELDEEHLAWVPRDGKYSFSSAVHNY
jgi:DNA-binding response OmpR family regulator